MRDTVLLLLHSPHPHAHEVGLRRMAGGYFQDYIFILLRYNAGLCRATQACV